MTIEFLENEGTVESAANPKTYDTPAERLEHNLMQAVVTADRKHDELVAMNILQSLAGEVKEEPLAPSQFPGMTQADLEIMRDGLVNDFTKAKWDGPTDPVAIDAVNTWLKSDSPDILLREQLGASSNVVNACEQHVLKRLIGDYNRTALPLRINISIIGT